MSYCILFLSFIAAVCVAMVILRGDCPKCGIFVACDKHAKDWED